MSKNWTSLSVTEEQKEVIESHKPDGMAMGAFLVEQVMADGEEVYGDPKVEQVLGRLDDLESSIPNKTADELMGRINR